MSHLSTSDSTEAGSRSRVKAEYRYPVYDLDDSIEVARIVRDRGGGAAGADALASYLNYGGTNNGAFLTRIGAARLFGLIERQNGSFVPTDRAMRILAPERHGIDDASAKVEAFKGVPLYGVLLQRYRGQPLPPEAGLRNALETQYGIPKGRTQVAYRVFMDSAATAGYFEARGGSRTHLVQPPIGLSGSQSIESEGGLESSGPASEPAQPEPLRPRASMGILERLQEALVEKIRDIPADDLDKVREYIREIKALEAERHESPPNV